jgi:N-methylhydantoinase A/oxoprolinase/acetone carboxylase beta subunit
VVPSPVARVNNLADWKQLLAEFDEWYGKIYSAAAKYPQAGYQIFEVGLVCVADKIKPILKQYELSSPKPSAKAKSGSREAYFDGKFIKTAVYDMDELLPGNEVDGPALIEHPTTTVVLPQGRKIKIDKYRTMHLSNAS